MGRCLLLFPTTAGGTFVTTVQVKATASLTIPLRISVSALLAELDRFSIQHRELCTLPTRHNRSSSRTSSSPDADASRPAAGAAGTPVVTNRLDTSVTAHQLTHRQISGLARPTVLRICVLICN